ncbi:MAG TPA: hypothetical protein VEH81_00210 [Ktedonobacteraceae bacterium]|nr:hypothetical protein [Ktedonobacteraceae bacterium]
MNITPEEAQAALKDIEDASTKARSIANIWAYYMLLWGVVWATGFLATQFQPEWVIGIWIVMVVIGMAGSALIGITQGGRMRPVPGSHLAFIGSRLGIFYGVLYSFAILWLIIFPLNPMQIGILWITVVMFGSIIAGTWINEPLPIIVGVGITVMSVVGYYLIPHYFWIWAAVFAGLPLIGVSIYYLREK